MKLPLPLLLTLAAVASADPTANRAARRHIQGRAVVADPASEVKPLITVQRALKLYDIPYSTLRQWIREGRMPAYRMAGGRQIRIRVEDLEAMLTPIGDD